LGVLVVNNLASTGGEKSYRITDTRTDMSVTFAIAAGQMTGVVSLEDLEDPNFPDQPDFPTFPAFDENPPTLPPWAGGGEDGPGEIGDAASSGGEDDSTGSQPNEKGAKAAQDRINSVDAFEDLPNVGTTPNPTSSHSALPWFVLLIAVVSALGALRLRRQNRRP
jgi:hypothetical protein